MPAAASTRQGGRNAIRPQTRCISHAVGPSYFELRKPLVGKSQIPVPQAWHHREGESREKTAFQTTRPSKLKTWLLCQLDHENHVDNRPNRVWDVTIAPDSWEKLKFRPAQTLHLYSMLALRTRSAVARSTASILRRHNSSSSTPPKSVEDSTSAIAYKSSVRRTRPPPLPATDLPRIRSAEEAVTNILYNTPPPSQQPFKK